MIFSVASLFILAATSSAAVIPGNIVARAPGVYIEVFSNLTGSIQVTDFITFALVDTVAACEALCDSVAGCGFVNTFLDHNAHPENPTALSCSLYVACHDASEATNTGGQTEPDQTVNFITDSAGFCKVVPGTTAAPTPTATATATATATKPATTATPTATATATATSTKPATTAAPTTTATATATKPATTTTKAA